MKYAAFKNLGGTLQNKNNEWTVADGTKTTTSQAMLVCLFLANANQKEFGECTRELRNDAASKLVRYPTTLEDAYTMLDEFVKKPKGNNTNDKNNYNNNENVNAYLNIAIDQPEHEICLTSTKYDERLIDASWVLLDTASTVTIFSNALFLRGIRKAQQPTTIYTSGGTIISTMEGYLPFLQQWVAYHPACLGNILSFRDVLEAHDVTLNSRQSHKFTVHCLRNGTQRTGQKVYFRPSGTGLYYFDTAVDLKEIFKRFRKSADSFSDDDDMENNYYEIVNATVEENLRAYSPRQRTAIMKAKEVYADVGRPSQETFLRMIKYRQLPGLPITEEDARNMLKAYGPDVHALRGKTVRRKANHVPGSRRLLPPDSILRANGNVTLCTDMFRVDGLIFLLAVSRNLRHVFVDVLDSTAIINHAFPMLKRLCDKYAAQQFKVREIHADPEFRPMKTEFLKAEHGSVDVHICATKAHVPEAERNIRTVKERNRATVAGLPYLYYPRALKVAIVRESARYLNILPHPNGVSEVFSPFALIEGTHADYTKHCALSVGSYCEVHDEPDPSNTETVRTTSGIALYPTPELDGPWVFLSLQTG